MPKNLALELIHEFERADALAKIKAAAAVTAAEETSKAHQWLRDRVELHSALRVLPAHLRDRLPVRPGSWTSLPTNRHKRKRLMQGYVAHLYAGDAAGYTFEKATQERALGRRVLELDIKRGEDRDLLNDQLYGALLWTTLDGALRGVIGGPNCRSQREEYGLGDLSAKERQIVCEDDLLLWRLVFLGIVGDYVAKAKDLNLLAASA